MIQDDIMLKIMNLPGDLINLVKEYIPKSNLIFTNRENYNLYHNMIKIVPDKYNNYVKDMIKRDNELVLNAIIRENYLKWFENGKIYYKNAVFRNYMYFIINYCIKNESENCLNIITIFLKELGLDKNLHKKNVIKYIKWKDLD